MTDERGEFFVAHVAAGDYHLDPSKDEDGYPSSYWGIYSDSQPVRVTLDALTHAVTGVVLVLGSKAALFTGTISDAVTNKPISNATVKLWRTDKATFMESSQGSKIRVLLPTGVPVGISLRAAGYEDWDYKGVTESSITGASKFSPGEELNIEIKLTPKTQ